MYFISNFFLAIVEVLDILLALFMWIVLIRAVLSWVNPDPHNPLVKFIHALTDPIIRLVHSKLPTIYGGIDFSPIIVFLCVIFLKTFVINSLTQIAQSLI